MKEEKIKFDERLLSLISDNVDDLVAILDLHGNRLYSSRSYTELLGNPDEYKGADSFQEVHPDDRDRVREIFMQTIRTGAGQRAEYRFLRKDGTVRHIESQGNLLNDEQGKPHRVVVISRDITERKEAEKKLKLLSYALSCARDCFCLADLQNNFLFVNPALCTTYGYGEHELLGRNIDILRAPGNDPAVIAQIEPATIAGGWNGELINRRKDGTEFPVELWTSVVRDDHGEPIAYVGIARDITIRKQAQRVLRESEERYRLLFDNNPQPMWVFDAETLEFLAVNDAAVEHYGYSRDEFLSMTIEQIRPPEDLPALRKYLDHPADGVESISGIRHRKKDGALIDVEILGHEIEFGGHGARLILAKDVSEQLQIERAIRASESKYRTLVETMSEGMVQVNRDDVIEYVNDRFCQLVGFTREQLLGTRAGDLLASREDRELVTQKTRLRERGISDRYETRIRKSSGEVIWVEIAGSPVRDAEGAVVGSVAIHTDITERKEMQEVLAHESQLWNTLMDNIPDTIYFKDRSSRFTRINTAQARVLGVRRAEDAIGKSDADYFSTEHARQALADEQAIVATGEPLVGKIEKVKTAAGKVHWFSTTKVPFRNGDGTIGGIIGSSRDISELKQAEELESAIYRIAEKTSLTEDIQLFYTTIHGIISELMYARNFYIALYDAESDVLSFPYFMDEVDVPSPPQKLGQGLTAYVLRTGKTLLCDEPLFKEMMARGEVELVGVSSPIWLGVPLMIDRKAIGVMVVQHYSDAGAYGERERHILEFVSSQVAKAIDHKRAEEALRDSEKRYRMLIENSSDAVFLISADATVLYATTATTRLLGYSVEEFVGRNAFDFMHPADLENTTALLRQLIDDPGMRVTAQYRYRHKDGSWRWLEGVGQNLLAEPSIHAIVANYRDITDTKRASEEREVMFEIIQGVSFTKDLDELLALVHRSLQRILYAENCFIALYDKTTEMFSNAFWIDKFDPPFSPQRMKKSCTAYVFRTGMPVLMTQGFFDRLAAEGEVELVGSNSPSWLGVPLKTATETIGVLVLQHYEDADAYSQADLEFLSSVGNQVALAIERKRIDDVVRRSEEKYRTLFEESQDGVFLSTPEGKLIDVNAAAMDLFGYSSKEEILNIDVTKELYLDPQQREMFMRSLSRQGFIVNFENVLRRKDGETRTVLETASAVRDEKGVVIAYRGFLRDITQRKKLEDQLRQAQKMEGLGTLAGGIAHDFNNLLGIILGYATLIESGNLEPKRISQSLDTIKKAVERGAGLVRQLLTFARKADPFFESINVNETVIDLSRMLTQTFPKTIRIELQLRDKLPLIVADATQLHQALLNLCLNARDAIMDLTLARTDAEAERPLTLITEVISRNTIRYKFGDATADEYVVIKVQDSGTGMDEATKSRIFEPFFTTKELGKGTGLGLAVVYGVINSHHAFIDVESSVGVGTTFNLYFPVQSRAVAPASPAAGLVVEESIEGGQETILLVEDEELLLELLKGVLEGQGYKVLTAADGMEGIELYTSHKDQISLVLSDMGLPRLGGWDMFQRMKEVNPEVRAILASGYFDPNLKMDMLKAGAKDFIQKPYVSQEILKRIREVIDEEGA